MFDPQPAESNGAPASGDVTRDQPHDPALDPDLAQLIHEHHASLYRYAFRLAGNSADAEDLTQQTFVTAHEKLHQVRSAESVRGWLFTVLRNGFLKSRRRQQPVAAATMEFDLNEVPDPSLTKSGVDGERIRLALDELPDDFRLVLVMFYFEECSYKEIADKLEIPLGTVMSRLSRAKQRLRERLTEAVQCDAPPSSQTPSSQTQRERPSVPSGSAGERAVPRA